VVDHEVGDDPDAAIPCGSHELDEVAEAAEPRVDRVVVGDVIAVVAVRRGIEGHQPEAGDAEAREVVHPPGEPVEVADPVTVSVLEELRVDAVEDGVLPPEIARAGDVHRLGALTVPGSRETTRQRGQGFRSKACRS
jgi:hypothetical protein